MNNSLSFRSIVGYLLSMHPNMDSVTKKLFESANLTSDSILLKAIYPDLVSFQLKEKKNQADYVEDIIAVCNAGFPRTGVYWYSSLFNCTYKEAVIDLYEVYGVQNVMNPDILSELYLEATLNKLKVLPTSEATQSKVKDWLANVAAYAASTPTLDSSKKVFFIKDIRDRVPASLYDSKETLEWVFLQFKGVFS